MAALRNLFSTRWGMIGSGVFIGVFAALLQRWGNPGNMGICVACFGRDISGALGLHRADIVQYMRPEIIAPSSSLGVRGGLRSGYQAAIGTPSLVSRDLSPAFSWGHFS